jgi:hypothetical protein
MPIKEGYDVVYYSVICLFFITGFLIAINISRRTGKSPFLHFVGIGVRLSETKWWERLVLLITLAITMALIANVVDFEALRERSLNG